MPANSGSDQAIRRSLPRKEVTTPCALSRVRKVSKLIGRPKWPYQEFNGYLKTKMQVKGIRTPAELSRLSGVREGQLSNWRSGKNQPTKESLRKLAPVLGVPVLALEVAAGITAPEEIDIQPDDRVWPAQLERAMDAYLRAAQHQPDLVPGLLERIDDAVEWLEVKSKRSLRLTK